MTLNERIGYEMRTQRLIRRLTIREVAKRTGKGKSQIGYMETGKSHIYVDDLKAYCEAVGCDWIEVLRNAEQNH